MPAMLFGPTTESIAGMARSCTGDLPVGSIAQSG